VRIVEQKREGICVVYVLWGVGVSGDGRRLEDGLHGGLNLFSTAGVDCGTFMRQKTI